MSFTFLKSSLAKRGWFMNDQTKYGKQLETHIQREGERQLWPKVSSSHTTHIHTHTRTRVPKRVRTCVCSRNCWDEKTLSEALEGPVWERERERGGGRDREGEGETFAVQNDDSISSWFFSSMGPKRFEGNKCPMQYSLSLSLYSFRGNFELNRIHISSKLSWNLAVFYPPHFRSKILT